MRRLLHVGEGKIRPREEQRLAGVPGQGIGEAVAEVQPGPVVLTLAVAPVSPPRDPRLPLRDRRDLDAEFEDDEVEAAPPSSP